MPSSWKRWQPSMKEFKAMVATLLLEAPNASNATLTLMLRNRCPNWPVPSARVRQAVLSIQKSQAKKQSEGSDATGSKEEKLKVYPQDIVELRKSAQKTRDSWWQWRGQVLRVGGIDDGNDDDFMDLPQGTCSLFWLGWNLEQWPNNLLSEKTLKILDRPWVVGDRVARATEPGSLGVVTDVTMEVTLSRGDSQLFEVPIAQLKPIGGFRAEDWVAHSPTKWVGKIGEAVYRVEVEVALPKNSKGKKPPACVFQVSSEGLEGLESGVNEEVTPHELCPHFPGQRVRAPLRLWKQAEWIRGKPPYRNTQQRGKPLTGYVTSVQCTLLAVNWLASVERDTQMPDEWLGPEAVSLVVAPGSTQNWALGDHVLDPEPGREATGNGTTTCVIAGFKTAVDVLWADGTTEEEVPSLKLCPRPHVSARDYLPLDFVAREPTFVGDGMAPPVPPPWLQSSSQAGGPPLPPIGAPPAPPPSNVNDNINSDDTYGYQEASNNVSGGGYHTPAYSQEILPTEDPMAGPPPLVPPGIIRSVDLENRTAMVQWNSNPDEPEEMSVFEIVDHPQLDVRFGDIALVMEPVPEVTTWFGRVKSVRPVVGSEVLLECPDGTCQYVNASSIMVVDDFNDGPGPMPYSDGGDDDFSDIGDDEDLPPLRACPHHNPSSSLPPADKEENSQDQEDEDQEEEEEEEDPSSWHPSAAPKPLGRGRHSTSPRYRGGGEDYEHWEDLEDEDDEDENEDDDDDDNDEEEDEEERDESRQQKQQQQQQHQHSFEESCLTVGGSSASNSIPTNSSSRSQGAAAAAAAASSAAFSSSSASKAAPAEVQNVLEDILPFDMCAEDVEPTDHSFASTPASSSKSLMTAVRREMVMLKKGLLDGSEGVPAPIIIRTYNSRSDLYRAMVVGPPGTPYADVPFFFDFGLPPEYPRVPPTAHFHAHYVGPERLNPNLYIDGKVCLSLLGTWSGPSWVPGVSTMLQVLVSLQGLVLVEEPYYNEPGHESDAGTTQGKQASSLYNEHARICSVRAALNLHQMPPKGFEQIVDAYFKKVGHKILRDCEEVIKPDREPRPSNGFRQVMGKLLPRLREKWGDSATPSACAGTSGPSSSAAAAPAVASS